MLNLKAISKIVSRFSNREKMILYGAAFFISIALLDRVVVGPIVDKMDSLNREIHEREVSIKRNLRILAYKDRISSEYAKYTGYLEDFESEEEEITSFLKEVETIANESAIYLIDMKPRGLQSVGSSMQYLVSLTCEAEMESIIEFMYNIENSEKLLTIEKYDISPKEKGSSSTQRTITISKSVVTK